MTCTEKAPAHRNRRISLIHTCTVIHTYTYMYMYTFTHRDARRGCWTNRKTFLLTGCSRDGASTEKINSDLFIFLIFTLQGWGYTPPVRKRLFPVSSLGEKRTTDDTCEDEEGGADFIGLVCALAWQTVCKKGTRTQDFHNISASFFLNNENAPPSGKKHASRKWKAMQTGKSTSRWIEMSS